MLSHDELHQLLQGTGVSLLPRSCEEAMWTVLVITHVLILIGFISFFFVIGYL